MKVKPDFHAAMGYLEGPSEEAGPSCRSRSYVSSSRAQTEVSENHHWPRLPEKMQEELNNRVHLRTGDGGNTLSRVEAAPRRSLAGIPSGLVWHA